MRETGLENAKLSRAVLVTSSLADANMKGADLTRAIGIRANVAGDVLEGANLTKSEFSRARFDQVRLFTCYIFGGHP